MDSECIHSYRKLNWFVVLSCPAETTLVHAAWTVDTIGMTVVSGTTEHEPYNMNTLFTDCTKFYIKSSDRASGNNELQVPVPELHNGLTKLA